MNILDLLFPRRCVGCNRGGSYFCPNCVLEIKQTELVCPFCERLSVGGLTHPICRRKYGLDGLWSLGIYQPPLKKGIQKLKYKWIKELAEVLVNITLEYWARFQPVVLDQIKKSQGKDWLIVPVPLHKKRQNWRGFNQSALLGKMLAKKTGLKYDEILIRTRFTKSQVSLHSSQRKQNIKGAFDISKTHNLTPNTSIILIDDVWTTGSTLKECCYVLKKGGVKSVWALTIAR